MTQATRYVFRLFLLATLLQLPGIIVFAQYDNNWYFGRKAALNFSTGTPQVITNSSLQTMEACASISDENGQLLFYTNGVDVYDRSNTLMLNGSNLGGDISSCQMSIVPAPGNPNLFYIFTSDAFENDFINGYRYSTLDMSMNGGLGAVTSKNNLLWSSSTERMTTIRHFNGIDIWLITNDSESDIFRAWLINCNGLQPTPVVSTAGVVVNQHSLSNVGILTASPDGKYLCQTNFPRPGAGNAEFFQLFDFDNSTGIIGNARTINMPQTKYNHAAFSPDSKLLYLTRKEDNKLDQLEITLPSVAAIQASRVSFDTQVPFYDIQLAVDEKIYIAQANSLLAIIHYPNRKGIACTLQQQALTLDPGSGAIGLPSHINDIVGSPGNGFDYIITNPCNGEVQFNAATTLDPIISWQWDFGDGFSSNLQNPLHVYADPQKVYKVKLSISSLSSCGKVVRTRQVYPSGIGPQTISFSYKYICDSGYYRFTNESSGLSIPGISYRWEFGDGGNSADPHPVHVFANPGAYPVKLKMLTSSSCFDDSVTTDIDVTLFSVQTIPDQTISFGESVTLTTTSPPATFIWDPPTWLSSSTAQHPIARPRETTLYKVTATDPNQCKATDSVRITVKPPDNVSDIFVPSAFTPNNDGRNDLLRPFLPRSYILEEFSIYNRWGQPVYRTSQTGEGWDGKIAEVVQDSGVYIWMLKARDSITGIIHERKGHFTLIR
jgi:gliding motility-associated-like protein